MMIDTKVRIGKLTLQNPVMVASGTFGEAYSELTDVNKLGAYVAKTITLTSRRGNPAPRIAETAAGMLNAIGLENKGVDDFFESKMPYLRKLTIPVVVSVAADNERELAELAGRFADEKRVGALEVNLSCPNVCHGKRCGLVAHDERATGAFVAAARKKFPRTLIAKLTPSIADMVPVAIAAREAGADALLVANTVAGMAIDIGTRAPKLGNVTGGLSGPAIKPITMKFVFDVSRKVSIPVIGCGGIMGWEDAVEYLLAGASAVQVGTASFISPSAGVSVVKGVAAYLKRYKIARVRDIIGSVRLPRGRV